MTGKAKRLLGWSAGFFVLAGTIISTGPALAQGATDQNTTATDQNTAQTGAPTDQLQEVVVTAERRETNLLTTPISAVAISGDQLQATHSVDINSLAQSASNLLVYTTGANTTIDIRGVGNSNQGGVEEPGVIIIRDGLPNIEEGAGENIPYYDIADVEVLRGPQGTFAGDNSTGGAVQITTQNPKFGEVGGYADVQVATYSDQRIQGAMNLPVNDSLALRLAVNEETRGSFFRSESTLIDGPNEAGPFLCNGAPPCLGPQIYGPNASYPTFPVSASKSVYDPGNVDNKNGRLSVLWKPTDSFQSLTKIEFDHMDSDGIPTQPDTYTFSPLAPGLPCPAGEGTAPNCHNIYAGGYSGSPYVRNDWFASSSKFNDDVNMYSEELRYTLSSGIALRLVGGDQEINMATASSTSADSLNVGSYSQGINYFHLYTGEFDVISPTTGPYSSLNWIAGLVYGYNSEQEVAYDPNVNTPYSASNPSYVLWSDGQDIWEIARGVFGQVSWQFAPTLQLVVGARYGWDSQEALGDLVITRGTFGPPIVNSQEPIGGHPSDRVPTGKVDLNWQPVPGQFLYAFVARGYKPGEENLGIEGTAHYETVNDYELGWKSTLADGHLHTQLGGYYMQYSDMIYGIFNPAQPRATSDANIPYSNVKGIELSLQALVANLGIDVNASYNKSVLGTLVDAATYKFPATVGTTPQCVNGQVPNSNNTNCTDYTPYLQTLSGESLPYAPEFTMNAALQYKIPLGSTYLTPRITYTYTSKSYSSIFQTDDYYLLPAHGLVGANLAWTAGPYTLTAYGTNLANTVYLQGTGFYGSPRQVGLDLNRTF